MLIKAVHSFGFSEIEAKSGSGVRSFLHSEGEGIVLHIGINVDILIRIWMIVSAIYLNSCFHLSANCGRHIKCEFVYSAVFQFKSVIISLYRIIGIADFVDLNIAFSAFVGHCTYAAFSNICTPAYKFIMKITVLYKIVR